MTTPEQLTERYVALWNEPDPDRRHETIRELWAPGGAQVLEPPEQMRDGATQIGFPPPRLECRGHEALAARVARAHDEFVAAGGFLFRSRGNASRLDDVVKFNWEMVPAGGGAAQAVGLELLLLDDEGRIRLDYQFIES